MSNEAAGRAPQVRVDWIRHEIRNPLNVLVGSLRLLEMAGVTPQQQKQIDMCRGAVDRITAILDGLGAGQTELATRAATEFLALGGVTFLPKPFERSDLLRTVQLAARTHRNLRLLAADDVPEVGWLLESLLASSRCTLEMVRDGATVVEKARSGAFDVILLDLEMPGMNGVEAARAIRANEKADGRAPVPLVIVSGHDLEGAAHGGPESGDEADVVTPDPEVAPLVPEFLENRRTDVTRLPALIEAGDWDAVRSAGHKMKGTGKGYGFARITDLGRAIEQAGANEDAQGAREAVAALASYLARVRVAPSEPQA